MGWLDSIRYLKCSVSTSYDSGAGFAATAVPSGLCAIHVELLAGHIFSLCILSLRALYSKRGSGAWGVNEGRFAGSGSSPCGPRLTRDPPGYPVFSIGSADEAMKGERDSTSAWFPGIGGGHGPGFPWWE